MRHYFYRWKLQDTVQTKTQLDILWDVLKKNRREAPALPSAKEDKGNFRKMSVDITLT